MKEYHFIFTIFIGFLGSLAFVWLKIPIPWLLGSIFAVIIFSRFVKLQKPKAIINIARASLGVTIASAFSPSVFEYALHFLISLFLLIPFVIIIAIFGIFYYQKVMKFDKKTSFFCSMPGGILEMISLAEEVKADIKVVTISQSVRLLFIVFTLPFILHYVSHVSLTGNFMITKSIIHANIKDLILMIIIGFLGAKLALRFKLAGAYIVGPMVVGSIFYILDLVHTKPPDEVIKCVQVILGSSIGFVFQDLDYKFIIKSLIGTFGYFLGLCVVCSAFIYIATLTNDFSLISVILAFSPGGQSEINIIAITIAANVPYVAIHHLFRVFLVTAIIPNVLKKFKLF